MTLEMLRSFFGWCAVINIGLLLWWVLFITFVHDFVYRVHGKFYKLTPENFNAIHYGGMGLFKILIFIFNVAPYIALRII